MDFTFYPNIQAKADENGGIKQTMFNKKLLANAENAWRLFTVEELGRINYDIAYAPKVMTAYITPNAILDMSNHVMFPIPVRDIIWVYGNVVKQSMNFIPMSKYHSINIMTRDGEVHTLGPVTTGGFSKKDICAEATEQIRNVIYPYRQGIVYGFSDEIQNYFCSNVQEAARMVDAKSMEANNWPQQ